MSRCQARYHRGVRVRVLEVRSRRLTGEEALEGLEARGVLELHGASAPLLAELRALGCSLSEPADVVRACRGTVPPLVDLTGLEAPEPMHRVLVAFAKLAVGEVFLALLPHRPAPLFPHLDARRASYEVALRPDGTALLWLSR